MIIDFHYHLAESDDAVESLLKEMDESEAQYTLLMGGPTNAYWEYKNCYFASNEKVLAAVKAHSERLIGNVYLDPREVNSEAELDRYVDAGFRCVKMFSPVGFWPDDERYFPLYEKIEGYGIPVLFHAGQTNIKVISKDPSIRLATNSKYSHPLNFDMIARLFPKMSIVLAHMGYPHYMESWSVAHANTNIYLDISGSGPWTEGIPLVFNALGGHNFIPVDFQRVIWGSDNTLPQVQHIARSDVYMRQMGADKNQRKLIFGETARKLLNL